MTSHINSSNRIITGIAMLCISLAGISGYCQEPLHQRIAQIVEAEAAHDLFSGTVLVAKDGKVVYAKGVGEENKEYHAPNVLETRFNISSVQKAFIATVTMQLVHESLMSLEDPLTKYYPDCPWNTADQIQIKNLLNHTCGLGDYRDSDEYRMNSERYTCIDDVLPLVFQVEPAFAPGERFRYSNAGVLLLKGIIERVTSKKLNEVLTERIFEPLGMDNTTMFVGGQTMSHRATAYGLAADGVSYQRVMGEPSAYSGGGIYTTVLDLLRFDQALYDETLLSTASKTTMFTTTETSPSYALGWVVVEFGSTTVIYHGGGSGGFNSEFRRYPEKGYTVIVLSNYAGAAFDLANKIDCMLLGMPYAIATEADKQHKLGMHFQEHQSYAEAVHVFERAIDSPTPHMPSLYQAARTRILGEFDQEKAIELLDRYINLADETTRPSAAAAWWRKGVAFEQLGDTQQAVQCYDKALELDISFEQAAEALQRLRQETQ